MLTDFSPRLSVVIVTRNRGAELRRLLTSLRFQSYKKFEVLVIHGPSSEEDSTVNVVAQFPTVVYKQFHAKNIAAARNFGLDLSLGEFVVFIDDDAIPEPDCLKNCLDSFNEGADLVAGVVRNPDGLTWQYRGGRVDALGDPHHVDYIGKSISRDFTAIGALFACRKTSLLSIGGFDEVFSYFLDETEMNIRMTMGGFLSKINGKFEAIHEQGRGVFRSSDGFPTSYLGIIRSKTYFLMKYSSVYFDANQLFMHFARTTNSLVNEIQKAACLTMERKESLISSISLGIREGLECSKRGNPERIVHFADRSWIGFECFSTSKRITICCKGWNIPDSGIGNWTRLLAKGLSEIGYVVSIIAETHEGERVEFLDEGLWVHHIKPKPPLDFGVPGHIATRWPAVQESYDQIVERRGCDIFQYPIWDVEGLKVFNHKSHVVTVVSLHTTYGLTLSDHPEWLIRGKVAKPILKVLELEKDSINKSHGVLANSVAIVREIEESYGFTISGNLTVVPHAHEVNEEVEPSILGVNEVVFVGRLEQRKGIDIFLKSVNLIKEILLENSFKVRVIGAPGSGWSEIKRQYKSSDLDWIHFEGFVGERELNSFLSAKPILVMPSRFESFGLVALEGMSHACSVIASNIGGLVEVLKNGDAGVLVSALRPDLFADEIMRLVLSDVLRVDLQERAHKVAIGEFNPNIMAQRISTFYETL